MNLEQRINDKVTAFLTSDAIENKIGEAMNDAVDGAVRELFTSYKSPVKEAIEEQLKSQMIPAIERFDFSEYIVKLDQVLVEVLKNTTVDNKEILENFKKFASFEVPEKVTTSEIFEKWLKHVSKNIDTSNLEVEYYDEPAYTSPNCSLSIEDEDNSYSWSSFEYAKIELTCEEDEKMNVMIKISKFGSGEWTIDGNGFEGVETLRRLNDFEIYLMNLSACHVPIEIDEDFIEEDSLEIEAEPEANFS